MIYDDGISTIQQLTQDVENQSDHSNLDNRNIANQHPAFAIQGVVQVLNISAGVVNWNVADGLKATLLLDENVTALNITGLRAGDELSLETTQDGIGGSTISGWDSKIQSSGGFTPNQSLGIGEKDLYSFVAFSTSEIIFARTPNIKDLT